MPPNRFESEVESFLEGSHGDRTHIKRADHPRLHHYAGRYSERVCRAIFVAGQQPRGSHWAILCYLDLGLAPAPTCRACAGTYM